MFPSVKSVKTNALLALKGNWSSAIGAMAVPTLAVLAVVLFCDAAAYIVASYVLQLVFYTLSLITGVFIGIPSFLGVLRIYKDIYDLGKADFTQVFFYFSKPSRYFRAVRYILSVAIPIALASFLLLSPSIALDYISEGGIDFLFNQGIPIWVSNLSVIATFLRCAAVAVIILIAIKFYMSAYIFVINDYLSPIEIIRSSFDVSYYSNPAFITLLFSMLGWALLGFLIIPAIFTVPYMVMSYVTHAKYAVTFYNNNLSNQNA